MLNMLLTFSFQLGCFLPILAICWLAHGNSKLKIIAGALAVMLADTLVVTLTKEVPGLYFEGQSWNWFGKGAEILLGLAIFSLLPRAWRKLPGVRSKKWITVSFAFLAASGIFIGFLNQPEPLNAQTMLFQLLMPSLSEELVYRGILLALFMRAFAGPRAILFSTALVTAWFGIIHGVGNLNGAIHFDLASLLIATIVGGLLVILRVAARTLMYPILGHSLYNLWIQIVPILRW
jgi:membrane protease YdiL (CAAX protease family)